MEQFKLDTPESIQISYDIAGIGNRFLAAAIDATIWIAALIILILGSVGIGLLGDVGQTVAIILFLTLLFVLLFGYYIIFETVWNGQSPGKRLLGIRVIKTSGYPIRFADAAIRNVIRLIDFLPFFYGIGVIVMFLNRESRRLGDYAAGTLVVKERSQIQLRDLDSSFGRAAHVTGLAPPRGSIDPEELEWNLRALTPQDIQVIAAYLDRAAALSVETRERVGHEITGRVVPRVGSREPTDPVQFLQRLMYLHETER